MTQWAASELTYCSNVHPGETPEAIEANIARFLGPVREQRQLASMTSGLWISQEAADCYVHQPESLGRFQQALADHQIQLMTLNGFPYGGFHQPVVKAGVYSPNWADPARLKYTQHLAQILAACLPESSLSTSSSEPSSSVSSVLPASLLEGTISTLPLGYREDWNDELHDIALTHLCQVAVFLQRLYEDTGKSIRVCLEMEPDCVLEHSPQIIRLFQEDLPQKAQKMEPVSATALQRHLGICFDVCHQAVVWESIPQVLKELIEAEVPIGKMQLSSALAVPEPALAETKTWLAQYAEPKYFHQLRTHDEEGNLVGRVDLAQALKDPRFPTSQPWRIHFHVPIQAEQLNSPMIRTTQTALVETLTFLQQNPSLHPHLEVETYTWQVLPPDLCPQTDAELIQGLVGELKWLEQQMIDLALLK